MSKTFGMITAVIKTPYPITYPLLSLAPPSVPSLFSCSPREITDTYWQLLTPGPLLCSTFSPVLKPSLVPAAQLHLPLSSHLLPIVLYLSLLVLLQPTLSHLFLPTCSGLLSSDIKAIWWTRLSQTVHRNKVHCCLPCTMRNQLIDMYWHTVYRIDLLYHRQLKLCIVL